MIEIAFKNVILYLASQMCSVVLWKMFAFDPETLFPYGYKMPAANEQLSCFNAFSLLKLWLTFKSAFA